MYYTGSAVALYSSLYMKLTLYMFAYASCKPYIRLQKTLITQGRRVGPCVLPTLPEAAKARETRSIFKPTTLSLEFLERSSSCICIMLFEMIKEWPVVPLVLKIKKQNHKLHSSSLPRFIPTITILQCLSTPSLTSLSTLSLKCAA